MSESQQRYRVLQKLEAGGMAEVFRAESEGLQGFKKQVAIKRVLPDLGKKKKFISMFLDEARLSAQLSHSNCVQVFDIGAGDGAYFIVMEFVDGANLKAIAESMKKQNREFSVQAAAFIALEICKGLSYAHEVRDESGAPLHIVHRDMSPPNVLITKYGEIKIVDFGLAKASSQLEKSEPGIIKGKFSYLSPEAAMGQEVDLRTDIYAVGIILWELLTQQRLFLGETDYQTVKKVQDSVIPSISQINTKVPRELERILNKTLQRDPAARYQTARELGQELARFLYTFGQPVSTFDIAEIVTVAIRDREKVRAPQGSKIDKLIEEALFEFTSLRDDEDSGDPAAQSEGVQPLHGNSFVDPTNWANELNLGADLSRSTSTLADSLPNIADGNLSALEDHEPLQVASSKNPQGVAAAANAQPTATSGAATAPTALVAAPAAKKGGVGAGAIGLVVTLLLAAAAGAAYFGGVFGRK
ncbi:MAG: serine/threonine protein kinase [Myxococcales bacterium]|nr:serine/threonine protein kinase [Myxococcales bacterium]HQY64034.1 serine/threonine-protein kinase [Polyangiaceae bacterium]